VLGIEKYNNAMLELESPFIGQPHGPLLLIKLLIMLANPKTGIVNDISYNELAKKLTVKSAPGRKDSGTPTKQTIRNYIKSIERECGEYFEVISEGHNLQFLFPKLPKIFNDAFESKEVNTGLNCNNPYENTKKNHVFSDKDNTEVNTEVNIPDSAVKKLFINNKTNNNNNFGEKIGNKNTPKTISQDFYPNQETIARAIAAGHHNATDANIIQEFIDKNTAWGSTFADFNPIFLGFLAKHAERKQLKESVTPNTQTRSRGNERTSPQINSYNAALEAVKRHNQNACKPTYEDLFPSPKVIGIEPSACLMALDGVNQDLRPALSY